jgi:hypothetical protein
MKKTRLIIAGLLITALLSCSSSGNKSGSSLVTITVGSNKSASISIQRATLYARLKNFLAEHLQVSSAMALIPSNVASIQITVQASDIATITKTVDTAGLASVSVTIEVPNGFNRQFAVIGFEGPGNTGNMAYWGGMSADLNGSEVFLPISMINLGSVTNILYVSTGGNDTTGTGTEQNPYRTISQALRVSANGNQAIVVGPGTYDANSNNPNPETFPLQLNLGTALVCRGANHSTVIDSNNSSDVIYGNVGASVQFCTVRVCDATGINDSIGGGSISPTPILINNVLLDDREELQPGCGALDAIILGAASTVVDATIKNPLNSGITVNTGNPTINNNTITGNNSSFYGILINAGSPAIDSNAITGFSSASSYGILVSNGTPTITRNSVHGNDTGISAGSSTANPLINNNSIYCNTISDLFSASVTTINATNNSWDHAPPTLFNAVTAGCSAAPGSDICYSGTLPDYSLYTVVPSPCLP